MKTVTVKELPEWIGQETGVSDWIIVDQARIDAFAACTEDTQFIHVDPERAAAESPFGGTVAHGFLSLSLLSRMAMDATLLLDDILMAVNYGFNSVRFVEPVRAGERVRGQFTLANVEQRRPGQWAFTYAVTVQIDGRDKPALVAEWLTLQMIAG